MSNAGERYLELNKQLFDEWKSARDYKLFCNDGILGKPDIWYQSDLRIMFLLKESNDGFRDIIGNVASAADADKGSAKQFWPNLGWWTYAIKEVFAGNAPTFPSKEELLSEKCNYGKIEPAAYVNVKKNAENQKVSNKCDLEKYARRDREFLKRQIELINPNVVVCCGTDFLYRDIYSIYTAEDKNNFTDFELWRICHLHNDRLVIDFYHPACRIGYEKLFYMLRDMLLAKAEYIKKLSCVK